MQKGITYETVQPSLRFVCHYLYNNGLAIKSGAFVPEKDKRPLFRNNNAAIGSDLVVSIDKKQGEKFLSGCQVLRRQSCRRLIEWLVMAHPIVSHAEVSKRTSNTPLTADKLPEFIHEFAVELGFQEDLVGQSSKTLDVGSYANYEAKSKHPSQDQSTYRQRWVGTGFFTQFIGMLVITSFLWIDNNILLGIAIGTGITFLWDFAAIRGLFHRSDEERYGLSRDNIQVVLLWPVLFVYFQTVIDQTQASGLLFTTLLFGLVVLYCHHPICSVSSALTVGNAWMKTHEPRIKLKDVKFVNMRWSLFAGIGSLLLVLNLQNQLAESVVFESAAVKNQPKMEILPSAGRPVDGSCFFR